MAAKCTLTRADEPRCEVPAVATIVDADGKSARACLPHAIEALDHITGSRVDWGRSKGLNEYARKALELSGGR
jgi:hypothetical protein